MKYYLLEYNQLETLTDNEEPPSVNEVAGQVALEAESFGRKHQFP